MITYKYKLYQTKRTKHLDAMLREASFAWNHALVLQKRYYSQFGKYIIQVLDRFYPSSKTCECGYVNRELKLSAREWVCPECGKVSERDLNAAENILRRGISELWSKSKTVSDTVSRVCTQESHAL